jgi:hypothetical protein
VSESSEKAGGGDAVLPADRSPEFLDWWHDIGRHHEGRHLVELAFEAGRAARVVPEIPTDWSQYPKSSEGTIRCTCGDYPHAKWCGNIPTQTAWEQGFQRGYSTERVGQKPEAVDGSAE